MYQRLSDSTCWAARSYQSLVYSNNTFDSTNFFETTAFLTKKEKKKTKKGQENRPYNKLFNCVVNSYCEWKNGRSCIRKKNKKKSVAKKKKKLIN